MKHVSEGVSEFMRGIYAVGETTEHQCKHESDELRKMLTSNGRYQVKRQCIKCGKATGGPYRHADSPPLSKLPEWDKGISERYWSGIREDRDRASRLRSSQWWRAYNNYLKSDQWKAKRAKVLRRSNGICEGCGEERPTHVHHETYERVGNEMLFDLRAVCESCHKIIHAETKR